MKYQTRIQPDSNNTVNQDLHQEVKAYYDLIGEKTPKNLLKREINLYAQLSNALQDSRELNKQFKNSEIVTTSEHVAPKTEKWYRAKTTTSKVLIILSLSVISAAIQFALDSDRRDYLNEIKRLNNSELAVDNQVLIQQNRELNQKLETAQKKNKECILF